MKNLRSLVVGALAMAPLAWSLSALGDVVTVSPEGSVKDPAQVQVRFSDPMVPFGDAQAQAEIFEIKCPGLVGQPRWVDPRIWVVDIEKRLPAATECKFKLKAGLKSLDGKAQAVREFMFVTERPQITSIRPWDGSTQVDETPAFMLTLDGEVTPQAFADTPVYLEASGLGEKIQLKRLSGREAQAVIESVVGKRRKRASQSEAEPQESYAVFLSPRTFAPLTDLKLTWGKQTYAFKVREPFKAELDCERETARGGCISIAPVALRFSEEVSWLKAKEIRLVGPGGKQFKPEAASGEGPESERTVRSVSFKAPLPEKAHFEVRLPKGLSDESGRALSNAGSFPWKFETEAVPPLAKFSADFGILELTGAENGKEAVLPVTLRSLEPSVRARLGKQGLSWDVTERFAGQVLHVSGARMREVTQWMGRVSRHQSDLGGRDKAVLPAASGDKSMSVSRFEIAKPKGGDAFEVVGIPLKEPGFYVVELESRLLGKTLLAKDKPMYVATAALVTDLAVHFKRGREGSIAWVTSLASGKPVGGAQVGVRDCAGKIWASGATDDQGIARLGTGIPEEPANCYKQGGHWDSYQYGLMVSAEKGRDFSFTHTSWDKGIQYWRFNLPRGSREYSRAARAVLDRELLRAGDTVHIKHLLRMKTAQGFGQWKRSELPKQMEIRHEGSGQAYRQDVRWEQGDVAESEWKIPSAAKLGYYSIWLKRSTGAGSEEGGAWRDGNEWRVGGFRVEEFKVPLMRATLRPPAERMIAPDHLPVDMAVEYLAGGTAGSMPAVLRYQTHARAAMQFDDYDTYSFANGPVKERSLAPDDLEEDTEPGVAPGESKLVRKELKLDARGTGRETLTGLKRMDTAGYVSVEMEYRDPSGEAQTVTARVPTYPAERLPAIQLDGGSYSGAGRVTFKTLVVDLDGKPVADAPVRVDLFRQRSYSHRKRLVGGFYAYDSQSETKRESEACSGKTDARGYLMCEATLKGRGQWLLQARTEDARGRVAYANTSTWVYAEPGEEGAWFAQADDDRIDVLPEKKAYEPGEKAVFQVRMPFKEATALVTVEREGVIDAFAVPVTSGMPRVEVPIKPAYAPNAYIGVMVVRGRVSDTQATALVDLGRPAYKMGIAEVRVGWRAHELRVAVKPEKEVYPVRGKARVEVRVTDLEGKPVQGPAEVALAAVDEGLLLLKPNDSWRLLEAMMTRRGYEVETSTTESQVVGRRHFGLKALPAGGDGGKAPTRELFDTLLFWKARVRLDAEGRASVVVPLNDSITSFRIAAIATAGVDRFGTGEGVIRSTRDLMMFAGVPQFAREGDRFAAEVTVRNATAHPMSIEVRARVERVTGLKAQTVDLAAGESRVLRWDIVVPEAEGELAYSFEARTSGQGSRTLDHVQVKQRVVPVWPERVWQATLVRAEPEFEMAVSKPKDALAGGVRVEVSSSLVQGLSGVQEYLRAYPYSCLEQRVSRSVGLEDKAAWAKIVAELPSYLDGDGLPRYFASHTGDGTGFGSETLASYVLSVSAASGYEIAQGPRDKMLAGLEGFVTGKLKRERSRLKTADLVLRKVAALEALSRYGRAAWTEVGAIQPLPTLWPTSTLVEWVTLLGRMSGKKGVDEPVLRGWMGEADRALKSRLNLAGTRMGFATDKQDAMSWLMVSADVNAARLLESRMESVEWQADLPRIARGLVGRQARGHWDTTPANAWGSVALRRFAERFEKAAVSGRTEIGDVGQVDWAKPSRSVDVPWGSGTAQPLKVKHVGSGNPWVVLQSRAAIPVREPVASGYRLQKSWEPVEQKTSGRWTVGDLVRVRLAWDAQAEMSWVVINDPLPAGAMVLGSGLGGGALAAAGGGAKDVVPTFEERSYEAYRAYYGVMPAGHGEISYVMRLNQSGLMQMPTARIEAMYAPEMFGELPSGNLQVEAR